MRATLLIILSFLLSACVMTQQAKVLRYNNGIVQGKSFALVADKTQKGDLEFQQYAERVNVQLQRHGLPQANSLESAAYHVQFSYSSDTGKQIIESYPDYSVYGGASNDGLGIGVGGPLYDPYYRRNTVQSYTLYTHRLEIRITDVTARGTPTVWQGKASVETADSSINPVIGCLVEAVFMDFPAGSGVEQVVNVPLPTAACP